MAHAQSKHRVLHKLWQLAFLFVCTGHAGCRSISIYLSVHFLDYRADWHGTLQARFYLVKQAYGHMVNPGGRWGDVNLSGELSHDCGANCLGRVLCGASSLWGKLSYFGSGLWVSYQTIFFVIMEVPITEDYLPCPIICHPTLTDTYATNNLTNHTGL